MKAYGRYGFVHGGQTWKKDYHVKKIKCVNWWEKIIDLLSRGRINQIVRQQIKKDIEDEII